MMNEQTIAEPGDEEDDEEEEDDEDDEDDGRYATNTTLGELGLVPKHKFLYYFDFGDSHQFIVTVKKIETREGAAASDEYPRLVEAKGKAPRQYEMYEDEELLDEDEDDEEDEDEEP
jgi:Plasmid pRiA4b ORF-3-like protein.